MTGQYILAIDQGTTGTKVLIVDGDGNIVSRVSREFSQIYPQPGWVEHDPQEIWAVTLGVIKQAMAQANISSTAIKGIGITNQRETTVVWEKNTGRPVSNAIVWQCRRTAPLCEKMRIDGLEQTVREKTGLLIDAYFSATKLAWILDNIPNAKQQAYRGELLFGTIDTWLVWKMTGGRVHVTDYSNASRTMLFNIRDLCWDEELLQYFGIPETMMPRVMPSSTVYGYTEPDILGSAVPIAGIAGDQQAALFGQTCYVPGSVKNTYGTGCFLLMNTGNRPIFSPHGLLTTIAWGIDNTVEYALEGSVFVAGAAVQWLRDELKILSTAAESESLANSIPDNGGVYLVPAFVGLGAPHWNMYARGTLVGMTRGTDRAHLARAALEAIAYQTHDVLQAMAKDAGITLDSLKVDGGACVNNFLMQFQADILGVCVERPLITETTALGAAFLAGLAVDFWRDRRQVIDIRQIDKYFVPQMKTKERERLLQGWQQAIRCALSYAPTKQEP